jgi:Leucine-rich repeat (LRR) protein
MKKIILLLGCLSLLLLGILCVSCSKDEETVLDTQLSETMEFTLTGGGTIKFTATAQNMVVDWGDGATNNYTDADRSKISHTYQNSAEYTVRIQAKGLSYFSCGQYQLTALNVSGCTELTSLTCYGNQITALDVSHNTKLIELDCFADELTALDISRNTELTHLWCGKNHLTALDISHNTKLIELDCEHDPLTTLDVSHNTKLTELRCGFNQLTALDVSRNTKLTVLNCHRNQLTATAINALFTSLPTVQEGYIFVSGNPGAATCDRSIATAKGWSVSAW